MRMKKGAILFLAVVAAIFVCLPALAAPTKSKSAMATAQKPVKVDACYECHTTVGGMHSAGLHKQVNCISCHDSLASHLEDASIRPVTDMSWQACGTNCHTDQFESFMTMTYHRPARDDKSQPTNRIPVWYDKLMAPHGFTKEHAITRPHHLMMIDQYVVDRAFGGRFQPIKGWEYVLETGKVWDVLYDAYPEVQGQKAFLPQTATAANPVCISCKTADHILDWAYMGDPGTGAKWDRTSDVVAFAKATQHALNCFMCHDPHSAEPRIVRDALIDAMTNPEQADNLYQKDPNKTPAKVVTLGERGFERKIAVLGKQDSRLQCAQCHVEYNCNAGTNPATGGGYTFASRITNHFPLKDVLNLYDHYFVKLQFADFKNKFDGAWLWKGQHPEFETYYESTHSRLGVGCADCHFGQTKGVTSHAAQSPRYIMDTTCLVSGCHDTWTAEQGIYTIDSIKAYTKSRMRKAEYWLSTLIDQIRAAEVAGIDKSVIDNARVAHSKAHILWEYWTAENSDGFHNPPLARQSLTMSITESMNAVDMLEKAMVDKRTAAK